MFDAPAPPPASAGRIVPMSDMRDFRLTCLKAGGHPGTVYTPPGEGDVDVQVVLMEGVVSKMVTIAIPDYGQAASNRLAVFKTRTIGEPYVNRSLRLGQSYTFAARDVSLATAPGGYQLQWCLTVSAP